MVQEERIFERELPVLLNYLGNRVAVSFPFYEFDLVVARAQGPGYSLKIDCTRELFEDELARHRDNGNEFPDYNNFFECLLNSDVITYTNIAEFKTRYSTYCQMKKSVCFGLDTNLFYHGFPLNSAIDPSKMIICDIVKNEIEASINYKYSPAQVTDLKRAMKFNKNLMDEFVNTKTKQSRKAVYLALKQFKSVRDHAIQIPPVEPFSGEKERNDLIIVQTLKKYEMERGTLPIMLTADRNVSSLCQVNDLEYFLFEFPFGVAIRSCSPRSFAGLLFNLATVFGVIQCNSVYIFGEYRGKGAAIDELKLQFLDDKLPEKFRKDLHLCRKLMDLDIDL